MIYIKKRLESFLFYMKCLSWFTWIEFEFFKRLGLGLKPQLFHIFMNLLQILMICLLLLVSSFLCLRHKWMYDAGAVSEWRMFKHTGKFPLHLQTWLCTDRKDTLYRQDINTCANSHNTHIQYGQQALYSQQTIIKIFFSLTINSNSWAGAVLSYGYGSREMWACSSNTPFPRDMLLHCG